jgi:EAL domain-containing protein (putative c-di-GMP-specific phosphodiesterase class I)
VLNKQTIAEHTESDAIFASLRALGVDMAQGFGIHRPEPIEQYFSRPSHVAAAAMAAQLSETAELRSAR